MKKKLFALVEGFKRQDAVFKGFLIAFGVFSLLLMFGVLGEVFS